MQTSSFLVSALEIPIDDDDGDEGEIFFNLADGTVCSFEGRG